MRPDTTPHVWGTAPDFVGPRHRLREDLLFAELKATSPGARILNVGAGQGTFTNRLLDEGFAVTSTEIPGPATESLRSRVRGDVVSADATALPFPDRAFDAVVLGEVLEHIEDDVLALREACRVLEPGGVVAVSVPRNPSWFSASDEWAGHFRRYTRDGLVAAAGSAGLDVIRCRAWGFPISALYHRTMYERAVRRGGGSVGAASKRALPFLSVALRLDRLFVGVERGALGYLLTARRRD